MFGLNCYFKTKQQNIICSIFLGLITYRFYQSFMMMMKCWLDKKGVWMLGKCDLQFIDQTKKKSVNYKSIMEIASPERTLQTGLFLRFRLSCRLVLCDRAQPVVQAQILFRVLNSVTVTLNRKRGP